MGSLFQDLRYGALVVAEIALSLIILVGAGLLLKSFNRLLNVETGFKTENLLTVSLPLIEFRDPQRRAGVVREAIARVAELPGIQAVSGGSALPPINAQRATRFAVQGLPAGDGGARTAYFIGVCPDYFRALGTPLREGREFTERDDDKAAKAVIINQTMARNLFPNESALGKRLQIINSEQSNEWREIGVRLALGAGKGDVLRLVLKQGMMLALIGVLLGLIGAWAMTRLMITLLFEVSATDPLTFATVAALLASVALLACWIPARRAAKVDPMIALRCE